MSETIESPAPRFTPARGTKLLLLMLPTVLVAVALYVIGEITVRYHERHRASVPGTMPSLYYRQIPLGQALVRDFDYFGWVHTNSEGFRGVQRVGVAKPPGTIRIIAVGGSTTFDTEVSADSLAWPARLERILNQRLGGEHLEVINAGVAGYGVEHDLIRLETELYAYHPDLIIFYQGHNDLFRELNIAAGLDETADSTRPGEVPAIAPWTRWLERHSLLYTKVRERLIAIRFHRTRSRSDQRANDGAASLIEPGAQNFERRLRMYLAVARTLGIAVVVPEVVQISGGATHEADPGRLAEWQHSIPFAPTDSVLAGYARYNSALRSVAKAYNVPFVPMVQLGIAGTPYYSPGDPIHFNDRGAERFASGLAAQLLQQHLIPPVGPLGEQADVSINARALAASGRAR